MKNGKVTMTFDDNDNFEGHFDIIPGEAFSIYTGEGERFTYRYCANDLADEVVGMWVCNDAPNGVDNDMSILSYYEDGSTTDLRRVLLPLFKNRKCGSKVAAEMGYFKPFSHLILYA